MNRRKRQKWSNDARKSWRPCKIQCPRVVLLRYQAIRLHNLIGKTYFAFAEHQLLKTLNELQEHQKGMTATACDTLKDRLKILRKAVLKASQEKTGATLKYSLSCIEKLCKDHDCPEEYSRIVALLDDTPVDAVHPKAATQIQRILSCWVYGLESSSERCVIQKKHVASLTQCSARNTTLFSR